MGAMAALREDDPLPDLGRRGLNEGQSRRLRRYSLLVTVVMMIVCNVIFLTGIWASGVHVDTLIKIPDIFHPTQDICLRFTWRHVPGEEQPVRLCSEWIQLSDPSGETHHIQTETEVVKGGDGRLYFDYGTQVDYHLFAFAAFVVVIIVAGLWCKRYLIRRYRAQLQQESASLHSSSSVS